MNLCISFPGGAGGNWLSHLIYCLQTNRNYINASSHFHQHIKSDFVKLIHDPNISKDVKFFNGKFLFNSKDVKFFNGKFVFNIYLNVMSKLRSVNQDYTQLAVEDRFELMASEASDKLCFNNMPVDLNWDNIFKNKFNFIEELYQILDFGKIKYKQDNDKVLSAIENFKSTCINPLPILNNFENELWLGWCNGIWKHEVSHWEIFHSIEQAQEILYPHRDYFYEYTLGKFVSLD